ncbi:MAG: TlpA family protein disulfide reductase, partial [Bacteroidales bacterium]|nr:TlpA family protein disulfide reductase [Bacteroidales bacterium]
DQYFNRVLLQIPDSIIPQVYDIVEKSRGNDKVFQYVIVFLLNNFQKSNIMGLDEVYVYIAEKYYLSGEASWIDSTFMEKLGDRIGKIKHNLIGRAGKDLTMETSTGEWVSLYQVNAKYTILYFWEPDCGFCKKTTPQLNEIYKKNKDKGLEIFAVYTQGNKQEWMDYLKKNELFDWINAFDPNQATYFRYYYDVFSTPVIYLLDKDKVIVAKRISAESLGKMLEKLL